MSRCEFSNHSFNSCLPVVLRTASLSERGSRRISISVALAGEPSTTHRTSFLFRFTFLRMRELLLVAVLAMGKLPWVEVGAVVEDSVIDTGGEEKVLMDLNSQSLRGLDCAKF